MTATGYAGGDPNKVAKAGDTMAGDLVLNRDPVLPLGAATKEYVDGHGGAITSVFGRVGVVAAQSGDYTAPQVGALATVNNLSDVANPASSRTNLGLGSAATANKVAAGTVGVLDATDPSTSNSRTPTGAASGDLSGTYPAPTVGRVNGVTISGSPVANQVPVATGSTAAAWTTLPISPYAIFVQPRGSGLDDSAQITTAIATAVTNAVTRGDCYAEVIFAPGKYICNGTPVAGGTTNGNAIIPLPVIAVTAQKVTLALRCPGADATGLFHWQQTAHGQTNGACLTTTSAFGASTPANGEVSVLGGPTPSFGYGTGAALFSNMLLKVEGISFQLPSDPQVCGLDAIGVAEVDWPSVGVLSVATGTGAPVIASTAGWQFGARLPYVGNNANCKIGKFAAEGMLVGLYLYEHLQADYVITVNCFDGLVAGSNSSNPHGNTITHAIIENCTRSIAFGGSSVNKLDIFACDIEIGASWAISDPNNTAYGTINFRSNGTGQQLAAILRSGTTGINGGAHLRITNLDMGAAPFQTSVKESLWGAAGDGVTDDLAAIQGAVNAVSAAGGGIVAFPLGTYLVSAPIVPASNVTLRGAGTASVLKTSANGYIIASGASALTDFAIDNLTFVGPVTNEPTVPTRARTTSGNGCTTAVYIDGSLDTTGSFPVITNFTMTNCRVRHTTSLPIRIFGVTGVVRVTDSEFTNCMDVGFGYNAEVICADNHSKDSQDNGISISRGNVKVTCTGNTVENACYYGIWVAGFTGAAGPSEFAVTGNTVRGCGQAGIVLMDGSSYGVVAGNFIDKMYYRGPSGTPDDTTCCGIYVRGDSTSLSAPAKFIIGVTIASNVIWRAAKAGIYLTAAVGVKVHGNQILDPGTQFYADGVTAIAANISSQNVGVYIDTPATCTNLDIAGNSTVDNRATPYGNYGVMPLSAATVNTSGNTMSGCRNPLNMPTLIQSDSIARIPSAIEAFPRWAATNATISSASGLVRFVYFTADYAMPMNKIVFSTGNTAAAATPTLCRFGLYTSDGSGNLTQIGQTASDTTIFNTASTFFSRAITATGLIAVPHQLYCLASIVVTAAATPTLQGSQGGTPPDNAVFPMLAASLTGQTDLSASYTFSSLTPSGSIPYARVTT